MQLREILLKSPETAVKQAADVLSKRGIKPTPERIEEYIQYLNRMLFGQDTPKDNQPD
jgi:predicted nucleotide-binding protein (sugar kinase/HSP70/actin superfamily)